MLFWVGLTLRLSRGPQFVQLLCPGLKLLGHCLFQRDGRAFAVQFNAPSLIALLQFRDASTQMLDQVGKTFFIHCVYHKAKVHYLSRGTPLLASSPIGFPPFLAQSLSLFLTSNLKQIGRSV